MNFSERKYIILSLIPVVNILLWLYAVLCLIKEKKLNRILIPLILESTALSVLCYMIPQKILISINIGGAFTTILSFLIMPFTVAVLDLNLIRLSRKVEM